MLTMETSTIEFYRENFLEHSSYSCFEIKFSEFVKFYVWSGKPAELALRPENLAKEEIRS